METTICHAYSKAVCKTGETSPSNTCFFFNLNQTMMHNFRKLLLNVLYYSASCFNRLCRKLYFTLAPIYIVTMFTNILRV